MPLHLLGKKSWNVYNTDNIARVRRDEADANAREAVEERRQRDNDGETRLAQLRGHAAQVNNLDTHKSDQDEDHTSDVPRKKRKLATENDTDRDMRLAEAEIESQSRRPQTFLTDAKGNIDLVQHETPKAPHTKDEANQVEGIRLADAAGFNAQDRVSWYQTSSALGADQDSIGRDVWGREDAGRKQRDARRLDTNDPLAAMKKGIKQLRQAEAHRQEWKAQREKDLTEVEDLAKKERRHCHKRPRDDDSIEGFDLETGYTQRCTAVEQKQPRDKHRHRHRHHRRRHSRSRTRSRSPRRRKERI